MRGKRGQASMELLLLLGLVFILILTISYYSLRPREEIQTNKVYETVKDIAESANNVAELDVGSKVSIKVEVPANIEGVIYADGEVRFTMYDGDTLVDVSEQLKGSLVGFRFFDPTFDIVPGTYDLILENYGAGTCIYPPGRRDEFCRCFGETIGEIRLEQVTSSYTDTILCDADGAENIQCLGATEGGSLVYGSNITGLRSRCIEFDNTGSQIDAKNYVKYTITNWLDEVVFDRFVFGPDQNGYFNLTDMRYVVENSDNIDITVTCYSECYEVRQDAVVSGGRITGNAVRSLEGREKPKVQSDLLKESTQRFFIPYGVVVPFLLDGDGNKIYSSDCARNPLLCSRYTLLEPEGRTNDDFERGNVESQDIFVLRTGFECVGGECINVDATLWHSGYNG